MQRARDLGIPFDGTPGQFNAITKVRGVEVGYQTLISGAGNPVAGKGPVRTGVTAILPRGKEGRSSVFAGFFSGNGNGDRARYREDTNARCALQAGRMLKLSRKRLVGS
jgi:D-aminopeptidase